MKKKNAKIFLIFIYGLPLFLSLNLTGQTIVSIDSIPATNQQQVLLHSNELNEDRTIWIRTPQEYNSSTDSYPVLYLLDGASHFKYVSETVDFLSNFETNFISKLIVVAIPNTDRRRDFTPVFNTKANSKNIVANGAGSFLQFIKNELIQYIDKNYRTQQYRILEGHSLGGLFAVYANEASPDLFQASIIISPALTGTGNGQKVITNFASHLNRNRHISKKFFFAIGNEDTRSIDLLIHQLKIDGSKSIQWVFKKYKGENHFSVPYKSMYDGLKFIYADWHTDIFLNSDNISYLDIENHFKQLSKKMGYTINPTEDFLNQCGYQQLHFNHTKEAIEFFKQNIKSHPNSFNVYDSMGEAYMIRGEKKLAIENYKKSIAINPNNENGKAMIRKLTAGD